MAQEKKKKKKADFDKRQARMGTAETVKNKSVILQTTLQAVSCQRFTGKAPFLGQNLHETSLPARETHRRIPSNSRGP